MKMNLSYSSPVLFLLFQFLLSVTDIQAELSVNELSSSFASNYFDIDSHASDLFAVGDDALSLVPQTDVPSSVPGSSLPVPTTLSPTDSEGPTSDVVRISMRGLEGNTINPISSDNTIIPTVSLMPTNSFEVSKPYVISQNRELDTTHPTTETPSSEYPTSELITLAPVLTNAPTESLEPTNTVSDVEQTILSSRSSRTDTASDDEQTSRSATIAPTDIVADDEQTSRSANIAPTDTVSDDEQGRHSNIQDPPVQTSSTSLEKLDLHSIQIEVMYDDNPEEISWLLMKHPSGVELEVKFNETIIEANTKTTFNINQLQAGKYYFRITDSGLDGLGETGYYRIIDTTGGGFRLIHNSAGGFAWFDYKEFYLGKQRDFYIYGYDRKILAQTDKFYTLE